MDHPDWGGNAEIDFLLRRGVDWRTLKEKLKILDVVALLADVPEHDLVAGQVGTLVEALGEDVFEVEFSDDEGRTYASLALRADQLILLHYSPVAA